jgi:imidazoleglycerol phosphate dehydratase HisB
MMPRIAKIERTTRETQVRLELNLDGSGGGSWKTGVGFLDHMLDLSGRYYLVFNASFDRPKIGDFDTELVEDFFQAFAANCLCNLHVLVHYGRNGHHIAEAIFKSAARALRRAIETDPRLTGVPSTKGTLTS